MADSHFCIESMQNAKVKNVVKLRNRREREKQQKLIIEGYRELLRASETEVCIDQLFICSSLFLGSNEEALIASFRKKGAAIYPTSESVFRKMSYRDRPDGLLAIAPQVHRNLDDLDALLKAKAAPLLVIAEAIEKPGNLGTILRSADAVGIDALILCDRCTDLHNPNVVRASVGTLFTVPVIETTSEEALAWLKKRAIAILAATPSAENAFTAVDLSGPLAIAVGTEQYGLSDVWMKRADLQVNIPMHGAADSLNVAMATTLLMYEALRQRHDRI